MVITTALGMIKLKKDFALFFFICHDIKDRLYYEIGMTEGGIEKDPGQELSIGIYL